TKRLASIPKRPAFGVPEETISGLTLSKSRHQRTRLTISLKILGLRSIFRECFVTPERASNSWKPGPGAETTCTSQLLSAKCCGYPRIRFSDRGEVTANKILPCVLQFRPIRSPTYNFYSSM